MKKLGTAYLRKAARQTDEIKKSIERAQGAVTRRGTDLSFREFIALVMPTFEFYEMHSVLIGRLQEVADGKLKRLLIQTPPRHGKSQLTSRLFPAYFLLRHPERFVAVSSYGMSLAEGFSRDARKFYVDAGGRLDPASQSVKMWLTEPVPGRPSGGLWGAGVGSSATGRGASLIVCDDPVKDRAQAESPAFVAGLRDWWQSTMRTRLEPEHGAIVVIQTRFSEQDLIGQLLENETEVEEKHAEGWHIVDLPAVAPAHWSERPPYPDTCTVEEDWREPGAALCPQRYDLDALAQLRASVGEREWAALFNQTPRADGGNIIDPDWFIFESREGVEFSRVIISVDCTFTNADTSDFVAMVVIGQAAGKFYILEVVNERLDIIGTIKRLDAKVRQWSPAAVLVEQAANGHAVMSLMRQRIPNMIGIKPAQGGSKTTRVQAAAPTVEAGSVILPKRASWVEPFVSQCSIFPSGKNDDMVDAFAQAINWLTRRPEWQQSTASFGYAAPGSPDGPSKQPGWTR